MDDFSQPVFNEKYHFLPSPQAPQRFLTFLQWMLRLDFSILRRFQVSTETGDEVGPKMRSKNFCPKDRAETKLSERAVHRLVIHELISSKSSM